jgi:hypothetical protein
MTHHRLVEDCLELDVNRLKRLGLIAHGARRVGRIAWDDFSINCEHDGNFSLLLRFPDGRGQRLMLVARPIPNGGHQWMFDLGGRRAFKLYLPPGGDVFRSRAAYGLDYRCRHVSLRRRREQRVERMTRRLGPLFDMLRPPGMWHSTWERKASELERLKGKAEHYGRNERQQERIKERKAKGQAAGLPMAHGARKGE